MKMSDPIDVRQWMPSIRRIAKQKLPLVIAQEELRREREATKMLIDDIKRLARDWQDTADEIERHNKGDREAINLLDSASCLERIVSEYENKDESL
tara:strand:- start:55 stop:342 length:288 start_codon:yes stop_codon:yes gene_type:complete